MTLHQSLADLARDHGQGLFSDPAAFRGSLDDYLDEGQASSGTINLLTDAVRLGAVESMRTMLDSGASPTDAVESAGQRLARDRGSADVRGCQWAVAVLGFALGKVPEPLVTGLDPEANTVAPAHYPPAGPAPTPTPMMSPVGPPQQPIMSPPHQPVVSPSHQPAYPAPYASSPGWSQPTPAKKGNVGFIVTAVVIALLVMGGGIFGIIAVAGDDSDTKKADSKPSDAETSQVTDIGGPVIETDDYTVQLSKGWQDGTEAFLEDNPDGGGSTFEMIWVWGDTVGDSRGSVVVESQSSFGSTDPNDLKFNWKNALVSSSPEASVVDSANISIDGQTALTVDIERTNDSGRELEQRSHLVINGDKAWSLTLTQMAGDDAVLDKFEEMLSTWKWAD